MKSIVWLVALAAVPEAGLATVAAGAVVLPVNWPTVPAPWVARPKRLVRELVQLGL
jgi:hypothetical protein